MRESACAHIARKGLYAHRDECTRMPPCQLEPHPPNLADSEAHLPLLTGSRRPRLRRLRPRLRPGPSHRVHWQGRYDSLRDAAGCGDVEGVLRLLAAGADVNKRVTVRMQAIYKRFSAAERKKARQTRTAAPQSCRR